MNGFKPNLTGRNYVSKGTHKKIWVPIACVAPPGGEAANFFVCSYVASPFDPLRTEKTADIGVAGFFTRRRRKDRKKAIFEIFVVGVLSVGYSLHRISDLHAKSMD